MTPQASIAVVSIDPDKCLTQRHVTHSAIDPENDLKEIIDVAINDLITSDLTTTVFFIRGPWLSKSLHRYYE